MLKSLTWNRLEAGVKAFNAGMMTTSSSRAPNSPHLPDVLAARPMTLVNGPAAGAEKPARFPLQEKDNGHQNDNLARHRRAGRLLEHLIGSANAQGGINGADNVADAAEHNRHKTVHDVGLA